MLKPIGKRLIVQPVEAKQGILFVSGQKPTQFTVLAVGDEITKVKVGDTIYMDKYHGAEIEHESVKYSVIDESSILAKLD